jgi:hypothetical protein
VQGQGKEAEVKPLAMGGLVPAGRKSAIDPPRQETGGGEMNKYHNRKTTIDGITFDSKKEAERYQYLKLLELAGEIHGLTLQPSYDLIAQGGRKVGKYRADFKYNRNGRLIVEDVKSIATKTAVYRLKKKIVEAVHHIQIVEV